MQAKILPVEFLPILSDPENPVKQEEITSDFLPAITAPLVSSVESEAKILTKEGSLKKSFEIEIKLNEGLSYKTGECLGISVPNSKSEVEYMIKRFGIEDADEIYEVKNL